MAAVSSKGKIIYQEEGAKTSSQIFGNLNPDADDAAVAAYLAEIGKLQNKQVVSYMRTDTKEITL